MSVGDGIYVEIVIAGSMDDVWMRTQDPALHEQWDLRFTSIEYLPRLDLSAPQRFLYATRIGFGLGITAEGESVGSHDGPGGVRTSALEFWSDDPKSLIRKGSGYWKYIPVPGGVTLAAASIVVGWFSPRFLTSAFNPVTLNGCVMALSLIALLSSRDLPSAARCRRRRTETS